MKTHLYKIAALALSLICYVSSASAQTYVDDLYYNKNNESHQKPIKKKSSKTYTTQQAYSTSQSKSAQPWLSTLENGGISTSTKAVDSLSASGPKAQTQSNEEYYPGMFAEAVGKYDNTNEYKSYDYQSDYQPSWYENTVYVTVVPSWYIGFGFGVNPYYYNPWMASPYYGGYWGNPWYVGYPYYNYGWHNYWYNTGWYNGWYNGCWYPNYGHSHYYPPRYTRSNSVYTGHVRGGGSSYRPSGAREYTRGGSSSSYRPSGSRSTTGEYRPSTTTNRSTTGQYRPSTTTTRTGSGQYRPATTTTRNNGSTSTYNRTTNTTTRNNGTVSRPATNNNSTYNRNTNNNNTTTRNNNTSSYNRSTSTGTSSYNRSTSTTINRSVGTGGGGGGTYNRRR